MAGRGEGVPAPNQQWQQQQNQQQKHDQHPQDQHNNSIFI